MKMGDAIVVVVLHAAAVAVAAVVVRIDQIHRCQIQCLQQMLMLHVDAVDDDERHVVILVDVQRDDVDVEEGVDVDVVCAENRVPNCSLCLQEVMDWALLGVAAAMIVATQHAVEGWDVWM
jgi:hypothetical protein